jgi:hypothetical protein
MQRVLSLKLLHLPGVQHLLKLPFNGRIRNELLLQDPNAVRIGQVEQATSDIGGNGRHVLKYLLHLGTAWIGKTEDPNGSKVSRRLLGLASARDECGISGDRQQSIRWLICWEIQLGENRRPARVRHIDKCHGPAGCVLDIEVKAAPVLGGKKACYGTSAGGEVGNNIDPIRLSELMAFGRLCFCVDRTGYDGEDRAEANDGRGKAKAAFFS